MKISRQKIRQLVREELAKARKKIAETRLNSVDKAWPQLDSGPPCPYCGSEEACEETCPSMTGELNEPCPECGGSHTESDSVPSMYHGKDHSLSCHDCKQTFQVDPLKGGYSRGSKMREADAPQTQKRPKNLWHGFPVSDKKEDPLGGKKSPFGASKSGAKKSSVPVKKQQLEEADDDLADQVMEKWLELSGGVMPDEMEESKHDRILDQILADYDPSMHDQIIDSIVNWGHAQSMGSLRN